MGYALPGTLRIGRAGAALAAGLLIASLLPFGPVATVLGASFIVQAASNTSISADTTSASGGTNTYTTLPDLIIQEGAAGDVSSGTLVLAPPTGFAWKSSGATVTVDKVGAPGTACSSLSATLAQTTSTITLGLTRTDTTNACLITVTLIQVIPTQGTPLLGPASIAKSGTATGLPSSGYGTLATVAGAAAKLGFTQQPSSSPGGVIFLTQPKVAVQDAVGNTITSDSTTQVTLAKKSGTPASGGPGTLSCTGGLSMTVTAGIATFSGCKVDTAGIGYRLTATDTSPAGSGHPYTAADSSLFDIPDNLGFETQPGGGAGAGGKAQGGIAFTNQPKVTVRAGTANFTTNKAVNDSTTTVTLSIRSGTGTAGAVLTCDQAANTLKVTNGSAQFTGCKIDKAGTGYQLVATSVPAYGTNAWYSTAFDVVAGPASKLTFTTQPAGAAAGQAFTTQPVVAITDAGGNVATTGVTANVTLTIGTNPGVPPGVLTCTPSQTVATATTGTNAGKAVFAGCKISNAGVGYTLVASATSVVCATGACATPGVLSPATSNAFTVTAPAAQIAVTPSASVITWGGTVVITTRFLVNGANKTFTLQGARDGVTWATIATLTTDAAGNASYPYRPATNLYYRVVFGGSADLLAGTSNTTRVVVRQIALLRPTNSGAVRSVARNTKVTFTTTVRPARPELPAAKVTFLFYRKVSTGWAFFTKRDVYINSLGQASWTWTFSTSGEWYVRSMANPTPYNANSVTSPLERYSVR